VDLTLDKPKTVSVLVVEDDEDYAVLVRKMLARASSTEFEVSHAARLAEAREQLLDSPSGCVLLDLSLPDARRLQALMQLRAVAPDVPIVVLSGLEEELLAVRALQEGAQDYLMKATVNPDALGRAISHAIERKQADRELADETLRDRLTGLPTKALFLDRLGQTLIRSRRNRSRVAVMLLDLKDFKLVNDTHGRLVGDQLLTAVGSRLPKALKETDTAARYGEDKFAVLCETVLHERAAARSAEQLLTAIEAPFTVDEQKVFLAATVGISVSGVGLGHEPEALLRAAEAAMYRAKQRQSPYELFDERMQARSVARSEIEQELNRAVERQEFQVVYQPQIEVRSGTVYGVEALTRWDHPERGVVEPAEFLALAEETGLIVPIGAQVLRSACRRAQSWQAAAPMLKVAVNLSRPEFRRPELIRVVEQALAESGADPASLCLEITERVAMEDLDATLDKLTALKTLGVKLSLDNFGADEGSLGTLKRLPVDFLKLDRSLVAGLGDDPDIAAIVACLIDLASELGMTTVAEGVESADRLGALRKMGCDLAQGDYLSRARPADAISELLGAR
jgi:diguanylate cyclase (GGDEF)-like protein